MHNCIIIIFFYVIIVNSLIFQIKLIDEIKLTLLPFLYIYIIYFFLKNIDFLFKVNSFVP